MLFDILNQYHLSMYGNACAGVFPHLQYYGSIFEFRCNTWFERILEVGFLKQYQHLRLRTLLNTGSFDITKQFQSWFFCTRLQCRHLKIPATCIYFIL